MAEIEPAASREPTFELFFEDQHARFLRALYLLCGDAAEAEDLMQDAFLKVWERWDRVSGMDDPEGYLFRTGMNLWRSRGRRAARAARKLVSFRRDLDSHDPMSAVDDHDVVMRALASLPPRQRAAVVVTELLDYSSGDAARILGVRASTVRALSTQGRAAMKREMEPGDG